MNTVMSIQNKKDDGKSNGGDIPIDSLDQGEGLHTALLFVLLLIFSGLSAFGLGRLSAQENKDQRSLVIETVPPEFFIGSEEAGKYTTPEEQDRQKTPATDVPFLVGSKNSDKYHFPWCSGARRIKPENSISFSSYEEARNAGYTPASNCDGLQ